MIYADLKLILHDGDDVIMAIAQPARSFIRNFIHDLYGGFTGVDLKRYTTSGSKYIALMATRFESTLAVEGGFGFRNDTGAGGASGIVLGSDDTPFLVADNNLKSTIGHGNGSGQMHRAAMTFGSPVIAPDAQSISMTFTRTFANNSGSNITVREIGLIGRPWWDYGYNTTHARHLFARDVLESEIVAESGRQLTVDYVIKTVL